jgi:hypothetical protein
MPALGEAGQEGRTMRGWARRFFGLKTQERH